MASKRAPRGWKKRVKRILLNVISIGRVCTVAIEAEDAVSSDSTTRCSVEVDGLRREVQLFREELGLKDARMARIPARRRPHYSPMDRMRILELKENSRRRGVGRPLKLQSASR